MEAVLKPKGLTNNASTGRTVATTNESDEAKRYIREAADELHGMFANVFAFRWYEVDWIADDHSIALPADVGSVLQVSFDGFNLAPLTRDDLARLQRSDDEGGGLHSEDSGQVAYYRTTGFCDEEAGVDPGDRDWRLVLRLYPTPEESKTFRANYIALAPALTVGADPLPWLPSMQRWIRLRAGEIWAGDQGDVAQQKASERERAKVEKTLYGWLNAMRDMPSRARARRPHVTRHKRWRR